MDRLTFEGNFCDIAQCESVPGGSYCENGACSQRKVWERLKEFEDLGYAPAALAKLVKFDEVTTRPPTEEENEEYRRMTGVDAGRFFDCKMPEDGDEILVKTKYGVDKDICAEDEYGIGLEGLGDWEDVLAWAEMPKGVKTDDP